MRINFQSALYINIILSKIDAFLINWTMNTSCYVWCSYVTSEWIKFEQGSRTVEIQRFQTFFWSMFVLNVKHWVRQFIIFLLDLFHLLQIVKRNWRCDTSDNWGDFSCIPIKISCHFHSRRIIELLEFVNSLNAWSISIETETLFTICRFAFERAKYIFNFF